MKENPARQNPAQWIERTIRDFINHSGENTLQNKESDRAWADPLVGFSKGNDPLYEKFKEVVGEFHWTPEEIFQKTFPGSGASAGELTVISWILPQTDATKVDNRKETKFPAERWARARIFGEEVNVKLRHHVVTALQAAGIEAMAPMLSSLWERKAGVRFVFSSTWSERHAAYASGLGTFGLCDGLITPKGKAHRCGSVIARLQIPPTPRPYTEHQAYCLFYAKGTCGKCIDRCPVGAITKSGHDKTKCVNYLHPGTDDYILANFGFKGYGCGLCQTAVPCESKIPV
jgi:epoxyqueuosine reductase